MKKLEDSEVIHKMANLFIGIMLGILTAMALEYFFRK